MGAEQGDWEGGGEVTVLIEYFHVSLLGLIHRMVIWNS